MNNPYSSIRRSVRAKHGVVATSEGLAAQAGLAILKQGGNAIDAAVATAAALTVVEPCSNGIGSDNFALVWHGGRLHGMNSSGPSSRHHTIDAVKARGHETMPAMGVVPITVPGTPRGWARLLERFGSMSLLEVLRPAIDLARNGFAIGETTGWYFEHSIAAYRRRNQGAMYQAFFDVFAKGDDTYKAGDLFQSDALADTLEEIGRTNADSVYEGDLADRIVSFMRQYDGFLDHEDLASFEPEFVDPIAVSYKGYEVCEIPPNGQGITALMALNLLNEDVYDGDEIRRLHRQIEALKIAFSDTMTYVTDPLFMKLNPSYLLSEDYRRRRLSDIGERAKRHEPIDYQSAGTVYLATADKDGNMVSFIQSNYMGFGSGIVIDGTGLSMQNRGNTFSLDPTHHNALAPRKRTYHTIIPGFLLKDGRPVGPFGVMGGFMQPQGHLQVLHQMIDRGMDPQAALDAPRFRWEKDLHVVLEHGFAPHIAQALQDLGHVITYDVRSGGFGRGQIIWKHADHYEAGTETRCDGHIAYY
jgi:gamma-glutamyltranspeptidase/glutathione hydrolase